MMKIVALAAAIAVQIGANAAQAAYAVYDAPNNFEVLRTFATACYQQSKRAEVTIWVQEQKDPDGRERLGANCKVEYSHDQFVIWQWREGLPVTEMPDLKGWLKANGHAR